MIAGHGILPGLPSVSGDEGGRRSEMALVPLGFDFGVTAEQARTTALYLESDFSAPFTGNPLRRSPLSRAWRCADASPLINFTRSGLASEALQIPPAWKLRIFCVYPLGIICGRSYHGDLSFLAKMQIDAEDGV